MPEALLPRRMIFEETAVSGAWVVKAEPAKDERGFFARTWDSDEFARRGLASRIDQCSISHNHAAGTLRGLHYQVAPHEEAKLVRCTGGAIFDVVLDLRNASATFRRWAGVELSPDNGCALYIPEGCAHGFLTLEDDSVVHYQISGRYAPDAARGVRWDDPAFGIRWPRRVTVINERDSSYLDFPVERATPR